MQDEFMETRLHAMEQAHAKAAGGKDNIAYVAVPFADTGRWRIAYTRRNSGGYWPISEDLFMGSESAMGAEADRLNRERLNLTPRMAALIVAESMR